MFDPVLLRSPATQRAKSCFTGGRSDEGWAPPSGHPEAGETVQDAVIRELHEETRLTEHIECLIGVYSDARYQIVIHPDGRRLHFATNLFACRVTGGVLAGSDEGADWEWFEPHRLPDDPLP
jgi:ADP-ribose pyrophosphatase YjhB (NUDIX family)